MEDGISEELEEVQEELDKKELEVLGADEALLEQGDGKRKILSGAEEPFFSPIFLQCFTMTFVAEWGDRSQIATIGLAAAKNPWGVTFGGILGHALCTALAVVGGKLIATRISEKTVTSTYPLCLLFCVLFIAILMVYK